MKLLITTILFVFSISVFAEDVWFCTSKQKTGFKYNAKKKDWEQFYIEKENKYTIKWNEDRNMFEVWRDPKRKRPTANCNASLSQRDILNCGYFKMHKKWLHYSYVSSVGYIRFGGDKNNSLMKDSNVSISTEIGICKEAKN